MTVSSVDVAPVDTHAFCNEYVVSTTTISLTPLNPTPATRNSKKNGQSAN